MPQQKAASGGRSRPRSGGLSRWLHDFDAATVFGLFGAFALISAAITLGGSWSAFIDFPAMLIVVGGTFTVTTISFSLSDIARTQAVVMKSLARAIRDPATIVTEVLQIAERCRREGLFDLHRELSNRGTDAFLLRGLELAADGMPGEEMERVMRREQHAISERHAQGVNVLHRAAEVAPAMGLIGTLVGLVQMLGNLEDPSTIGPSMAVALLTTFYGAILANTVFAPL
ncbi:MAG: motility protein A, partial [Alphaproteobacteria bacterium]